MDFTCASPLSRRQTTYDLKKGVIISVSEVHIYGIFYISNSIVAMFNDCKLDPFFVPQFSNEVEDNAMLRVPSPQSSVSVWRKLQILERTMGFIELYTVSIQETSLPSMSLVYNDNLSVKWSYKRYRNR